MNRYNI